MEDTIALCSGIPGAGKTMLMKRLPSILPDMKLDEVLEVTKIYSILGLTTEEKPLVKNRPFRTPHHTITPASLIGGGKNPKPRRNQPSAFRCIVFGRITRI